MIAEQSDVDYADWIEWRRKGIGGSDAAGIAGISPWASPMSVWLSKVGLDGDGAEQSEAMRWGILLEPIVIQEFENRSSLFVRHRQTQVVHPQHEWMRATLDGVVRDTLDPSIEALGVYEGKTAGDWGRAAWDDGVPEHYIVQVMHQMAITGLQRAWVVALLAGQRLVTHVIERDQESIDILMELEDTFWRRYVLTHTPPPVDGSERTTEAIRDAFTQSSAATIELPAAALDLVRQINAATVDEKAAAERAESARNTIRLLLGDAEVGLYAGAPLATWKQIKSDRIDVEELRAREPGTAARYTKTSSYRRLNFPKHKEIT